MDTQKKEKQRRPGPDPERLKLPHEDWRDAVREALEKKKPPEVWPSEGSESDSPGDD